MTAAHQQKIVNSYVMVYPEHEPRESDPHYKDFKEYRRSHIKNAKCQFASDCGDDTLCDGGLELHHAHVEFALANSVDLKLLEKRYPGISNKDEIGAWIESGENLVFYCSKHHRGHGGIHHAAASDWEGEHFIRGMIL